MPNDKSSWTTAERRVFRSLIVLVTVIAIVVAYTRPPMLRFMPFTIEDFKSVIVPLFLVALFIERAVEVFVTSWRGGDARRLDDEAKAADKAGGDPHRSGQRQRLSEYKARTHLFAFTSGTALGVIVAALGVRALEPFLYADWAGNATPTISGFQIGALRAVDVVLTGAVLGGGADGLHKLVSVFTNFMDSTSKKIKSE